MGCECVCACGRSVLQCWQAEIGAVEKRLISSRERARAKRNVKLKHMLHSEWAVCELSPLSLSLFPSYCTQSSLSLSLSLRQHTTSRLPLFALTWLEVALEQHAHFSPLAFPLLVAFTAQYVALNQQHLLLLLWLNPPKQSSPSCFPSE